MRFFKILLCLLIAFTFENCDSSWHISELYIQKIENSSKVIYKYDAWGGRDSHISGFAILDSTDVFNINNEPSCPFSYFESTPTKKMISGIASDYSDYNKTSNKIFTPLKVNFTKEQGIKIKTKIFQYKGFSNRNGGYETYQFETFKESHDSIFFYNLNDITSMEPMHLDTLKLKKSNIYIRKNSRNAVLSIRIEDLKLSPQDEFISNKSYQLTPKNKTNIKEFSNIGIFKEIKTLKN